MTRQEAFDRVWAGLRDQGFRQSLVGSGCSTCRYRGEGGRRCAIGHLITDEEAGRLETRIGGYTVTDFRSGQVPASAVPASLAELDTEFLQRLQGAHDSGKTPGDMETNLRDVAGCYRLRVP